MAGWLYRYGNCEVAVGCRSIVAARWPVGYTGMATARYIASWLYRYGDCGMANWLYRYGSCGMANGCWNIMADRGGVPAANACCCL